MDNIIAVFKQDIKGLSKNVLALIIAGGLCFLPCLYAWFNIYSNWDPYASTQNVPIAIASDDLGYMKANGTYINMGDQIIEKLHSNDKLGWTFTDTTQAAIDGVYSGQYYAAIIMDTDFSQSMYDCITNRMQHPKIYYYENEKCNAIAVKITDSGSSSLQSTINEEFTKVVITTISSHINDFTENESGLVEEITGKIQSINDNLNSYSTLIDSFVECNTSMAESLDSFKSLVPQLIQTLNSAASALSTAANTLTGIQTGFNNGLIAASALGDDLVGTATMLNTYLGNANAALLSAQNVISKSGTIDDLVANLKAVSTDLDSVIKYADKLNTDIGKYTDQVSSAVLKLQISQTQTKITTLKTAATTAKALADDKAVKLGLLKESDKLITNATTISLVSKALGELSTALPSVINYNIDVLAASISKELASTSSGLNQTAGNANAAVNSVAGDKDLMIALLDSASQMMLATNTALAGSQTMIDGTSNKIVGILGHLNNLSNNEKYNQFVDLLKSDPDALGSFLANPISVENVAVYETETYGSAVTPFYTTLALWVGAIILVALIKVKAVPSEGYENATLDQLYWGRMIIFILLGQLQAVMVAWGDLNLLHVQNTDKVLFYFACCATSLTFVLMIYTLTLSFGNIGKAFAVVIMIIQIAGSSGTYPIELLPDIFQRIYTYFPFPYAINMIRETISGRYQDVYWTNLNELLIFAVCSIVLGVWIRKPFMQWSQFIETRMSDTKMM